MQPSGLNALAAIVAATPQQASGASANGADDDAPGQQFSQLLSDSGKQQDSQQGSCQVIIPKMPKGTAANALSAQEVLSPAEQIAQLLAAREAMVTPADASELLKRVDTIAAQATGTADVQALSQIKDQLQNIINTGTPKSIAQILAASPAVKDAKLSLVGLTALLTSKNTRTQVSDHTGEEEDAPAAVVQTMPPVVVFRPDAGEAKAPAATAKSDAKKESVKKDDAVDTASVAVGDTVTVMVPLAMSVVQPVAVPVTAPQFGPDILVVDTMPTTALKPRSDIDQIIPPLTSNQGNATDLPEVTLPKAGTIADANAAKADASSFQAMAAAAGASDTAKVADTKQAANAQSDLNALTSIQAGGGAVATQTVSAVQPVAVIQTPGLVNHAQVTDQVSVAVTKASKDGIEHITIQLDPIGLGRVEVNMHTNREGQTQISFVVDKADTFDNLSRDARSLERSLQEAGIKADTGSMQFNMRQQPQQQMHSDMGNGQRPQQQASAQDSSSTSATTSVASIALPTTRNYLFNVREGVDISA